MNRFSPYSSPEVPLCSVLHAAGWAVICLSALLTFPGCGIGGNSARGEAFQDREEFAEFLSRANPQFVIPGLDEDLTPQGISYSETTGLIYITSYAMGGEPSVISAVSLKTGEPAAEYRLFHRDGTPFTGHVGGIAVAEDRVYLSARQDFDGSFSVAEFQLSELPASGSHDVVLGRTIPLPASPSFLNYSQGTLWIGNFYHPSANYGLPPLPQRLVSYGSCVGNRDDMSITVPNMGIFPRKGPKTQLFSLYEKLEWSLVQCLPLL